VRSPAISPSFFNARPSHRCIRFDPQNRPGATGFSSPESPRLRLRFRPRNRLLRVCRMDHGSRAAGDKGPATIPRSVRDPGVLPAGLARRILATSHALSWLDRLGGFLQPVICGCDQGKSASWGKRPDRRLDLDASMRKQFARVVGPLDGGPGDVVMEMVDRREWRRLVPRAWSIWSIEPCSIRCGLSCLLISPILCIQSG